MSHTIAEKPTKATVQKAEFEHLDPRTLVIEANVRSQAGLTEAFIDSIRQHGVLMPILVQRTSDGQLLVRAGQRRTLASIEAGQKTIPARVVDGDGDEARRLLEQIVENDNRSPLKDSDRVAGFQQLSLLGVSAVVIAKKTGHKKETVTTALNVAKSKVASAAQDEYDLTLDQAATIAGFEGDAEAIKTLTQTAVKQPGQFAHTAQRLRDEREAKAQRAAAAKTLSDAGIRQVPAPAYGDKSVKVLGDLTDASGNVLTADSHKGCPGYAGYVRPSTKGGYTTVLVCDAWKANKHKTLRTTATGAPMDSEAVARAKAERAEVIENNAAWRSAEVVRREWLAEFAKRKITPKDAASFIGDTFVTDGESIQKAYYDGHALAAGWLGATGPIGGRDKIRALLAKASPARALHIALVVAVAAIEARTGIQTWRKPGGEARYLTALESWGYALSPVEQIARGPQPKARPTMNPPAPRENVIKAKVSATKNAPAKPVADKEPAAKSA
jgi:ParB family chromosome partitioning protein